MQNFQYDNMGRPIAIQGTNPNPQSLRSKALGGIEHYDGWLVGEFIHKAKLDFFEGCIVKYTSRHRKKNGKKDLLKARDYIDKLIELNYPD